MSEREKRGPGMDHPHYPFSALPQREPLTWPDDGVFPTLCWPLPTVNYKNWAADPSNLGK